jgi:putative ABC transport system permease protein
MKWSDLIRLAATNLWRRKLRSVLTMIGVMIGTASIVVMVSIGIGINQGYIDSLSQSGELTTINISSNTYYGGGGGMVVVGGKQQEATKLDDRAVREISALEHVQVVSPQLDIYNMTVKTGKFQSGYSLTAINPDAVEALGLNIIEGQGFSKNASSDTIEILLGQEVKSSFRNPRSSRWDGQEPDIDWLNAKYTAVLQDYTDTDDQGNAKEYDFKARVVGIVEADNAGHGYNMYCSLDTMKAIMQKNKKVFKNIGVKTDEYPNATVKVDSFENVLKVQEQIDAMGLSTYSMANTIQQMQQSSKSLQLMLGGIGGVAMLVAAISICNTMLMSIYERTREIGVMKVLGCKMSKIGAMFLTEAGIIGLGGGILGLGISYVLSAVINTIITMQGATAGFRSVIPLYLAVGALAFSILVGVLAGLYPSQRAMRLSALAAIRNE